jgi:hypothetical protein
MNANSTGLNNVNVLGDFGGAFTSPGGNAGNDAKAIIIILPGKGDTTGRGDSTEITDSSCACDHHSATPVPDWKTPTRASLRPQRKSMPGRRPEMRIRAASCKPFWPC